MDLVSQDSAMFLNIGMVVFMFVIFYFLIIRPQKKADQRREFFQDNLKRGDKVVTAGGIYGIINNVGEQKVSLKISDSVDIDISKGAISRYQDSAKQDLVEQEFSKKK